MPVRDTLILASGILLLGSQVVGYFLGREVNVTLATIGVSLLATQPLLRANDRRRNGNGGEE